MTDNEPDADDDFFSASHGKVAFARIESLTIGGSLAPRDALRSALQPGTRIDRRGRTWLMGQISPIDDSLVGRIGFQVDGWTELWDESAKDFEERSLPAGTTSLFAIDPDAMRVAFQLRPGLIRVKSFTGALQALMNEASPSERWRVEKEVEDVSFETWASQVQRVAELRVRVQRPNPHYGDRRRVKALVEGANAQMATIVWSADPTSLQGLDINDAFIREAIEHTTAKYGSYGARGLRNGRPSKWESDQGASQTIELDADPETKEVDPEALRAVVRGEQTPEIEPRWEVPPSTDERSDRDD